MRRLAGLLLFGFADPASAHPLDEVVQGAYLTLAPGEVRLELELTPGIAVTDALLRSLDANLDHAISDAEGKAYAARVLQQSSLTLDGAPLAWRLVDVSAPTYRQLELGAALKIHAVARRPDQPGPHLLGYENRYDPAKSQCIANIFVEAGAGWSYRVAGQQHSNDGRSLTVSYAGGRL